MKSHLELAHHYWQELVKPGDTVIDATAGNGYDTLFLAKLLQGDGLLAAYDIQHVALEKTKLRLLELSEKERSRVFLRRASHVSFFERSAKLIVYNLGYLPGGDKTVTTQTETTLQSLECAMTITTGAISITCYPGHDEGYKEELAILQLLKTLSSQKWSVCYHQWINRENAPSLIWLKPHA